MSDRDDRNRTGKRIAIGGTGLGVALVALGTLGGKQNPQGVGPLSDKKPDNKTLVAAGTLEETERIAALGDSEMLAEKPSMDVAAGRLVRLNGYDFTTHRFQVEATDKGLTLLATPQIAPASQTRQAEYFTAKPVGAEAPRLSKRDITVLAEQPDSGPAEDLFEAASAHKGPLYITVTPDAQQLAYGEKVVSAAAAARSKMDAELEVLPALIKKIVFDEKTGRPKEGTSGKEAQAVLEQLRLLEKDSRQALSDALAEGAFERARAILQARSEKPLEQILSEDLVKALQTYARSLEAQGIGRNDALAFLSSARTEKEYIYLANVSDFDNDSKPVRKKKKAAFQALFQALQNPELFAALKKLTGSQIKYAINAVWPETGPIVDDYGQVLAFVRNKDKVAFSAETQALLRSLADYFASPEAARDSLWSGQNQNTFLKAQRLLGVRALITEQETQASALLSQYKKGSPVSVIEVPADDIRARDTANKQLESLDRFFTSAQQNLPVLDDPALYFANEILENPANPYNVRLMRGTLPVPSALLSGFAGAPPSETALAQINKTTIPLSNRRWQVYEIAEPGTHMQAEQDRRQSETTPRKR